MTGTASRPIGPGSSDSAQLQLYKRFADAARDGDTDGMLHCIDPDRFGAILPGQGRLVFTTFIVYLGRQRGIVTNQNTTITETLERPRLLAVLYVNNFTLAGHPHEPIQYAATDWVRFGSGLITELRVLYDRADAQDQIRAAYAHWADNV